MKRLVLVGLMLLVGALSFATPIIAKSEFIIENNEYNSSEDVTKNIDLYSEEYKESSFEEWTEAFEKFNSPKRGYPMWFVNNENETAIYEARWTARYIIIKVIYVRDNDNL